MAHKLSSQNGKHVLYDSFCGIKTGWLARGERVRARVHPLYRRQHYGQGLTSPPSGIESPFSVSPFVLELAGIQRLELQAMQKDDLHPVVWPSFDPHRFRAKRKHLKRFEGLLPEI